MKIISWNVNGIRSRIFNDRISSKLKKGEILTPEENSPIKKLLEEQDPDIFCFQETRCSESVGETIKIPGYTGLFNESKLDGARGCNRYSGTALYIKKNVEYYRVEKNIPGYVDFEGRIMIIYIKDLIIINVYAPNSGTNYENKIKFMDCFLNFLDNIDKKCDVVFCGDMNIAVDTHFDKTKVEPGPGFYKHELDFYYKLESIGYKDAMNKDIDNIIYTWWDPRQKKENGMSISRNRNKGWRLDYFFIRMNIIDLKKNNSKVLKYIGENNVGIPLASDHAPVFCNYLPNIISVAAFTKFEEEDISLPVGV
jgi:exodeoxyribonuclease III